MTAAEKPFLRTRTLTAWPILDIIRRHPEADDWIKGWAKECDIDPETLQDTFTWVSARFYYGLIEKVAALESDAFEEMRQAGRKGYAKDNLGFTFHALIRSFGTPRTVYRHYSSYLNRIQQIGQYKTHDLQKRTARISFTPEESTPNPRIDCAYRQGALEAVPILWDLPPAMVRHIQCCGDGDPCCLYEVTWTPLQARIGAWLGGLIGLGAGVGLWHLMAMAEWVPAFSPGIAALGLAFGMVGWLLGTHRAQNRQLETSSRLVDDQLEAIQKELKNSWRQYDELDHRARSEKRLRKLFQRYVPSGVIEKALGEDEEALSLGESTEATVVFTDLVGFTGFAERTAPEKVMETINRYLGRFAEVIIKHGGIVDKFIGDAVMILFGAPVPDPEGPQTAIRCALALLEATGEINTETGHDFRLRIGINTGPVVAGHVGSPQRTDYTVMGDTVNLAQRLESEAAPGTILVSESVRKRCADSNLFHRRGPLKVKGRRRETTVFELKQEAAAARAGNVSDPS